MAKVPAFLSRIKLNSSLLSVVLAVVIMLEGAVIAAMARQIDLVKNWGTGLYASTVALIGVQLFVLGLLALLCVIVNGEFLGKMSVVSKVRGKLFRDRAWLFPVFIWAPVMIGVIVAIEGLVAAYYASPMKISGLGNVRGMWLAAFGAQLFFVGSALSAVRLFDHRLDTPTLVRTAVLLLFVSFGVLIYGLAAKASITGIGGVKEGTVELLGLQMELVALAALAIMYLDGRSFLGRKLFGWKVGTVGVIGLSIVLAFEGMIVASVAAPFSIVSIGGMMERTMLLIGVGLAVLAMVVPASYYFLENKDKDARKLAYASTLFLFFLLPFSVLM
jgi:hypothetical protein